LAYIVVCHRKKGDMHVAESGLTYIGNYKHLVSLKNVLGTDKISSGWLNQSHK